MLNEDPVHIIGSFKNPANFCQTGISWCIIIKLRGVFSSEISLFSGQLAGPWQVEIKVLHVAMLAVSPLHCKVRPPKKRRWDGDGGFFGLLNLHVKHFLFGGGIQKHVIKERLETTKLWCFVFVCCVSFLVFASWTVGHGGRLTSNDNNDTSIQKWCT